MLIERIVRRVGGGKLVAFNLAIAKETAHFVSGWLCDRDLRRTDKFMIVEHREIKRRESANG